MSKLEPSSKIKGIIERHANEIANEIMAAGLRAKEGLEPDFDMGWSPFEIKTSRLMEPLGFITLLIRFIPDSSGVDLLEDVSFGDGETKH